MKLGRFTIEQLSEGRFEIFADGTIHRKPVDQTQPDVDRLGKNSSRIGINPVFVSDGIHHILLDTGLGWGLDAGSNYEDISNIKTNLDIFGTAPEDITHVILTHLHYDHSAGSSYTDTSAFTRPTFPNATYYVQQREWDYALQQLESDKKTKGAGYQLDDLYRLVADGRIEFLDEDFIDLVAGIKIIWTGGHTPGHQIVRIEDEGKPAYYLGDLVPSEFHLNQYAMRQMDVHPVQAKKIKIQLLRTACEEKALLIFYHSLLSRVGRLSKDMHKKYVLKEL